MQPSDEEIRKLTPAQREEALRRISRSASFQRVFNNKDGEVVLAELKKQLAGFDADPYIHAYNAGKQFMWDFMQKAMEPDLEKAREVLAKSEKENKNARRP
jgi:hypothetical protein